MTKRNKRGKASDRLLLEAIKEYPGLSIYELAKKLKWTPGRVHGCVGRLLRAQEIFVRVLERTGRRVDLVYPKELEPSNVIKVPAKLLNGGNPKWQEDAFFYALDDSTIGVSGSRVEEWEEVAGFKSRTSVRRGEGEIFLTIPENFAKFYNLDRKAYLTGITGGNLFITISGEIVKTERQFA